MEGAEISSEVWDEFKRDRSVHLRNHILLKYTHLVKYIANRMAPSYSGHVDKDDLMGYGILGLMDAIDKYDYTKGVKFETYASLRIKGSIIDQIRQQDWLPRSMRQKIKNLETACQTLEKSSGRFPNDEEVAKHMGISVSEVQKLWNESYQYQLISMDEQIIDMMQAGNESLHIPHGDTPEQKLDEKELMQVLSGAIKGLTDNEKMVVSLYYYEELTQKEIAKVLGVTESRVSQIHAKALLKLKSTISKQYIAC